MKKVDLFLGLILVFLVIFTLGIIFNPGWSKIIDINKIFYSDPTLQLNYWTVIGLVMVICFIGALIPIPIPYAIPVATFSYLWFQNYSNPWIYISGLILTSALGNSIGDSIDYLIGNGTSILANQVQINQSDRWATLILKKPRLIPIIIFLFALTPLPDSALLVPLGFVRYSITKTLFYMYLGKIGMMLGVALAGVYGIEFLLSVIYSDNGWITSLIILYAIWFIMVILVKVKIKKSI